MMKNTIYRIVAVYFVALAILCAFFYDDRKLLLWIGTIELALIAMVVNTFVIVYSTRNWRANPYGRALMYSKISLAALADLVVVTLIIGPDWPFREVVRVFVYGGILVAQARLLQLLFLLRTAEAREQYRKEHEESSS